MIQTVRYTLAWDVGIRNLAGCLLQWDLTHDHWTPVWWDVLDLRECEPGLVCQGKQRIRGVLHPCKCMPDWEYVDPGTDRRLTVCSRHKRLLTQCKANECPVDDPVQIEARIATEACLTCGKKARWQFQTKWYCATHAKKAKKDELRARDIVRIGEKATGQKGTDQWKERLWRKLDQEDFWLQAQEVLIENQPALRNPTMKSIAETLYCFFLCRGVIDREITGSRIDRVRFISPASKLDGLEQTEEMKADDRARYQAAKKFSIQRARELLRTQSPASLARLEEHPKKDDLCDALLLALTGVARQRTSHAKCSAAPS